MQGCRHFERFPRAEALQLPRSMLQLGGGRMLNTCTLAALEEMLRLLKRAYWPCAWDTGLAASARGIGSEGGFRCAWPSGALEHQHSVALLCRRHAVTAHTSAAAQH